MADVNDTVNGATPATNPLVISMELADWVYHRASNDQGLGLGEIESTAQIILLDKAKAQADSLIVASDGFIYNANTGFGCAIVENSNGSYTIAIRGTDFGEGSFTDLSSAALGLYTSNNPNLDVHDIQQDITLGIGTLNPQNQVQDALNVISLLQAQVPGAAINLVGQSLGGGVAGVAAAVTGLPATIIDPAPFASQLSIEAIIAAASFAGVANPANTFYQLGLFPSAYTSSYVNIDTTIGDYISSSLGQAAYNNFILKYQSLIDQYESRANITKETVNGELLSAYSSVLGDGGANQISVPSQNANSISVYSPDNSPSALDVYEALDLHSPTLAALAVATQNTSSSFAPLIQSDVVLQDALFEDTIGNTGAISHPRSDKVAVTSAVNGSEPDPSILERALLKTVGAANGLYAYFYNIFDNLMTQGAVSEDDGLSEPSLHSGFERLSLDVFRDEVQNTSTISDVGLAEAMLRSGA